MLTYDDHISEDFILERMSNIMYVHLPENNLDKWSIIVKLGPVIYEKTSYELRLEDYLANVNVKILNLEYNTPPLTIREAL